MLRIHYETFDLPFQYPFQIANETLKHQSTIIVFLSMGAQYGLGEATAISYNSIEKMTTAIEKHKTDIEKYIFNGPERFGHFLHHLIPAHPSLISAIDTAGWDMWSKIRGKKVHELMNIEWQNVPPTSYTLGIDSTALILAKIKQHPYPIYKLKVNNEAGEVLLKTVLEHTNAKIRIKADEAWTYEYFEKLLPLLKDKRIELIEQPFDRKDITSLRNARAALSAPIIADEAVCNIHDWLQCEEEYDGVVIKLSKCGGLTPALQMIQKIKAKASNKKIMLSSMNESNIGAAALAHLLPLADYANIDGPLLLKENVAKGFEVDSKGNISLTEPHGIGVSWR